MAGQKQNRPVSHSRRNRNSPAAWPLPGPTVCAHGQTAFAFYSADLKETIRFHQLHPSGVRIMIAARHRRAACATAILLTLAFGVQCLRAKGKPGGSEDNSGPSYTIIQLDDAQAAVSASAAWDINGGNLIVGSVYSPDLDEWMAAYWTVTVSNRTTTTSLGLLAGGAYAWGVNDAGEVVGSAAGDAGVRALLAASQRDTARPAAARRRFVLPGRQHQQQRRHLWNIIRQTRRRQYRGRLADQR